MSCVLLASTSVVAQYKTTATTKKEVSKNDNKLSCPTNKEKTACPTEKKQNVTNKRRKLKNLVVL